MDRACVIINQSCTPPGGIANDIENTLRGAGFTDIQILEGESGQMGEMLEKAKALNTDIYVAFGGDGTANAAAELARDTDRAVVPLPGGTMNLLHKALYGTADWKACLDQALQEDQPRYVPGGLVGNRVFLVGAIFGRPVKMADSRESVRNFEPIDAAVKLKDALSGISEANNLIRFSVDGNEVRTAKIVQISINEATNAFDLAALDPLSPLDLMSVGLQAIGGDWRMNEKVFLAQVNDQIDVSSDGELLGLVDGESLEISGKANVKILSECVKVLAPERQYQA